MVDTNNQRTALKTLAIGKPAVWAKPMLQSIVLQAHGSTSSCEDCRTSSDGVTGTEFVPFSDGSRAGTGYEYAIDPTCEGDGVPQVFMSSRS